jgi:hypothetical protein
LTAFLGYLCGNRLIMFCSGVCCAILVRSEERAGIQFSANVYLVCVEVVKCVMGWTRGAAERVLPGRTQGNISSRLSVCFVV